MVDVYSDIATKQKTPTPGDPLDVRREGGKDRRVKFSYELAGLAANSVIALCKGYKGEELALGGSYVMFDILGAGTSLDIGDDDAAGVDADRYADGIATTAAGVHPLPAVAVIDKVPYRFQNDCWITATILGSAGTGTLKGELVITRTGG